MEVYSITEGFSPILYCRPDVAKKMRTYFEMGTDGHRFLCFQFDIS